MKEGVPNYARAIAARAMIDVLRDKPTKDTVDRWIATMFGFTEDRSSYHLVWEEWDALWNEVMATLGNDLLLYGLLFGKGIDDQSLLTREFGSDGGADAGNIGT